MWDIMSLKCTNWRVKCNLCASSAVLALERRFACARARTYERVCMRAHSQSYTKSRPQDESGLKLPCAMLAASHLLVRLRVCVPEDINLAAA